MITVGDRVRLRNGIAITGTVIPALDASGKIVAYNNAQTFLASGERVTVSWDDGQASSCLIESLELAPDASPKPISESSFARLGRVIMDQTDEIKRLRAEIERGRAEWIFGAPNDGTFEYVETSDCDGSHIAYLRRTPKRVIPAGPWEKTNEDAYNAAGYFGGSAEPDEETK